MCRGLIFVVIVMKEVGSTRILNSHFRLIGPFKIRTSVVKRYNDSVFRGFITI